MGRIVDERNKTSTDNSKHNTPASSRKKRNSLNRTIKGLQFKLSPNCELYLNNKFVIYELFTHYVGKNNSKSFLSFSKELQTNYHRIRNIYANYSL